MASARGIPPSECVECHTNLDHRILNVDIKAECASCHKEKGAAHVAVKSLLKTSRPFPVSASTRTPAARPSTNGDRPGPMVLVPAGDFFMGSDERLPDEGPEHKVNLPANWMAVYEVTNEQSKAYLAAYNRRSPSHFRKRFFLAGLVVHSV